MKTSNIDNKGFGGFVVEFDSLDDKRMWWRNLSKEAKKFYIELTGSKPDLNNL